MFDYLLKIIIGFWDKGKSLRRHSLRGIFVCYPSLCSAYPFVSRAHGFYERRSSVSQRSAKRLRSSGVFVYY